VASQAVGADTYRIEVRGRLTDRFSAAFDGLSITAGSREGTTLLTGQIQDQSHLMGVLQTLDGLGIELISVNPSGAPRAFPTFFDSNASRPLDGSASD
jgi:hypothetical protein